MTAGPPEVDPPEVDPSEIDPPEIDPAVIDPAVIDPAEVGRTTAELRSAHRRETGLLQLALDRVTAVIGWPGFAVLLVLAMAGWIAANLLLARLGHTAPDPPPFLAMANAATAGALVVVVLILSTHRREDRLADHHAQLILELSIANDRKIAKIIDLLEEARRDNPAISNRIDDQAAAMATPSDAAAVLLAIRELNEVAP